LVHSLLNWLYPIQKLDKSGKLGEFINNDFKKNY